MKPILLFSDLHLREESADVCFTVLREIRKEAVDRGISTIGFLGDFWHIRYAVPVRLLNRVLAEFSEYGNAGLRVILLPGNHDQIDVAGENALDVFGALPWVRVYSSPEIDDYGVWIPYRHDRGEVVAALERGLAADAGVAFHHGPIRGALMNHLVENLDGIEVDAFRGFRKVLLGHYHQRQALGPEGRCQYVGSPWQTRADEAGQAKGYAIWDGRVLEYVDRVWGPRFHTLPLTRGTLNAGMLATLGVREGDTVRVRVPSEADVEPLSAALAAQGVKPLVEPQSTEGPAPRLGLAFGASYAEYARAYVNAECKGLDADALMRVFQELTA